MAYKKINSGPLECMLEFQDEGECIICTLTKLGLPDQMRFAICRFGYTEGETVKFVEDRFKKDVRHWYNQFKHKIIKQKVREQVNGKPLPAQPVRQPTEEEELAGYE